MIGLRDSLQWLLPHKWLNLGEVDRWMAAQDGSDERFGHLLAFGFGILQVFGWADRVESQVMHLIAAVVLGPIVGLALYVIGGGLATWALRRFGGVGDAVTTRSGLCLASLPLLWVMVLSAGAGPLTAAPNLPENLTQPVAYGLAVISMTALVWHVILLIRIQGKAHRLTGVRVFGALGLAGMILIVPGLACAWPISYLL